MLTKESRLFLSLENNLPFIIRVNTLIVYLLTLYQVKAVTQIS